MHGRVAAAGGGNLRATPAVQTTYMYFTAAYQPILLQAPFRNTSLKVSACCQTVRGTGPFVGSSPGVFMGKNGQSGLTALLGTPWSVPFQSATQVVFFPLHSRAPGKVLLQTRWREDPTQVDGPYYTNPELFHFLHLRQAEGNIHPTCTQSFCFALWLCRKLTFQKNIYLCLSTYIACLEIPHMHRRQM